MKEFLNTKGTKGTKVLKFSFVYLVSFVFRFFLPEENLEIFGDP